MPFHAVFGFTSRCRCVFFPSLVKCVFILYVFIMYNDCFFFFLNISLIFFCQPYCQGVLNPDKLKLFNYLNPGPRNQARWFILVCMRRMGEETTLAADGWPACVRVCVREKAKERCTRKVSLLSCHNSTKGKLKKRCTCIAINCG